VVEEKIIEVNKESVEKGELEEKLKKLE